ncbi:MAG: tetratricopeptide repeat protein [Bacteroidales bacterium]|nr:tetratricopeptide repeat protein [Bacteroidales bacterium]
MQLDITNNKFKIYSLAVVSILVSILYFNSINCSFQFDDETSIINNSQIKDLQTFKQASFWFSSKFITRPFSLFTFALNYYFTGLNSQAFHVTNIIIHIINSFLLLLLLLKLVTIEKKEISKTTYLFILLSVSYFAIHPLQTQSVTYIVQRMTSLAFLFYILTIFIYTTIRTNQIKGNTFIKNTLLSILLGITALLALLSKQNSITLPISILIIEAVLFTKIEKKYSKFYIALTALVSIAIISLLIYNILTFNTTNYSSFNYFTTQCEHVFKYIGMVIFPINQNIDHLIPFKETLSIIAILGFIVSLAMILFAIFNKKISKLLRIGILLIFSTSLIESSFFPIADTFVEHRTYLSFIGIVFITFYLLSIVPEKWQKIGSLLFISYLIVLSIMTIQRNKAWQSKITLWSDSVKKTPNNYRALNNLGYALIEEHKYEEAIHFLKKSLLISPNRTANIINLGACYNALNMHHEALMYFNKALKINENNTDAYNNLGILYLKQNEPTKAEMCFKKSITIEPNKINAYLHLSSLYYEQKKFNEVVDLINIIKKNDKTNVTMLNLYYLSLLETKNCSELKIEMAKNKEFILKNNLYVKINEVCH